jgi:hypothetical protein
MPEYDLTQLILDPGKYDAQIDAVDFKFNNPRLICIGFRIPSKGVDYYVWDELPFSAPVNSPNYSRTAEGKYRVFQILSAFNEKPPPKILEFDLEELLVGREVYLELRLKQGEGFPTPKVVKVLGKARQPVQGPYK